MAKNDLITSQKQVTEPWEGAAGGWKELMSQTNGMLNGVMQRYNNSGPNPNRNVSGMGVTTPKDYASLRGQVQGAYQPFIDQAGQKTASETNLADMAAGKMVGSNPYASEAINARADEALRRSASSLGGRTGRLAQEQQAKLYSDITNPAHAALYEADQNRMMGANAQIDSSFLNRMGIGSGLLNSRFGTEGNLLGGQTNAEMQQLLGQGVKDQLETWDPRWDFAQKAAGIYGQTNGFGTTETLEPEQPLWEKILGGVIGLGGMVGGFMDQPGMGGQQAGMQPGLLNRRPQSSGGILGDRYRYQGGYA